MQLKRPLIFFDLETTGTDVSKDRIVQIATIKVNLDLTMEEKKRLINPNILIPAEATAVHGITNEMVETEPFFSSIARNLKEYFKGCDIAGYHSDFFDIPLLTKEFERCNIEFIDWECNVVDVLKYERILNPQTLSAVYTRYTGNVLDGAHDALNDVRATVQVFLHQTHGKEITIPEIDEICQGEKKRHDYCQKTYINKDGVVCWAMGKFQNKPIDFDLNYLNWVLSSEFPLETKTKIRKALNI